MSDRRYYFPYECISSTGHDRVIIFGAGQVGSQLKKEIDERGGVRNICFLDNFATTESVNDDAIRQAGVYKPDIIKSAEYDYVVLACQYWLVPELCECLYKLGVNSRKILTARPGNTRLYSETPHRESGWDDFYDYAEKDAEWQIKDYFVPIINKHSIPLVKVLDFPSGHGRIAESMYMKYEDTLGSIVCCDANTEAVDFCRKRFAGKELFGFAVNKVDEMRCIPLEFSDGEFTFIYSWDSMVHFTYKWLDFYIGEFYRVLKEGGFAFIHHSNLGSQDVDIGFTKSENWTENPHGRTPVSHEDVNFLARRYGFEVVEQRIIDWGVPNLDCITLIMKP